MPKTKLQDFIFTVIMVLVMVYFMTVYNKEHNGCTHNVPILWLPLLAINFPFALIMQVFYIEPLVRLNISYYFLKTAGGCE